MEDNNQQILLQKLEIRSLKDQIIRLLEDRGGFGSNGGNPGETGSGAYGADGNLIASMGSSPAQAQSTNNNMRISAKMNQEKESFLPRVGSR